MAPINEDRLGLHVIYLQANRWEGSVGRPVVAEFAGSLNVHRARKGVIITISTFAQDAQRHVQRIKNRLSQSTAGGWPS